MLNEMFKDQVCETCGEVKLRYHFCGGKKTEVIEPVKSEIERQCQWYAINQWLSSYPDNMTYEDIIDHLQSDSWSDPIGDAGEDEDDNRIVEWYLLEGHSGDQIAGFIEETFDSAMRLVQGLIK